MLELGSKLWLVDLSLLYLLICKLLQLISFHCQRSSLLLLNEAQAWPMVRINTYLQNKDTSAARVCVWNIILSRMLAFCLSLSCIHSFTSSTLSWVLKGPRTPRHACSPTRRPVSLYSMLLSSLSPFPSSLNKPLHVFLCKRGHCKQLEGRNPSSSPCVQPKTHSITEYTCSEHLWLLVKTITKPCPIVMDRYED